MIWLKKISMIGYVIKMNASWIMTLVGFTATPTSSQNIQCIPKMFISQYWTYLWWDYPRYYEWNYKSSHYNIMSPWYIYIYIHTYMRICRYNMMLIWQWKGCTSSTHHLWDDHGDNMGNQQSDLTIKQAMDARPGVLDLLHFCGYQLPEVCHICWENGEAKTKGGWNSILPPKLVGGLEHFLFSHIFGMSSSQLTFIFFRGVGQPPTRKWVFLSFWLKREIKIGPKKNSRLVLTEDVDRVLAMPRGRPKCDMWF